MRRRFVLFLGVLAFLLCGAVTETRAQCGVNFKTNYRAVNKIGFTNGSYFQLADWTGDGKSDFYNFRQNAATQTQDVLIYPSKPTGYWDWDNPLIFTTSIPLSTNLLSFNTRILKDFNGDGRNDFLFGNRIYRAEANGSLTALNIAVMASPGFLGDLGYVDINGDNYLDWLYWASIHPTGQEIRYQLGTADGSFGPAVTVIAHTAQNNLNNALKAIGDFDGDGQIDIVYNTAINGGLKYVFLKGSGTGAFQIGAPVARTYSYGEFTDVKDFNNDGRADILAQVYHYEGQTPARLFILFGQANGTFNETELPVPDPNPRSGYWYWAAELNGDNHLDILAKYVNTEYEDNYSVYLNNGSGAFTRADYARHLGRNGSQAAVIEDFSGDGKADYYVGSRDGRTIEITAAYNMFGEEIVSVQENVCQAGETLRANFDSDPDTDLAVWNPSTGDWTSKNSRWLLDPDPGTDRFNWGLGAHGDVPAPGDFDADGKTDYAVYRSGTGFWYIRQSSDAAWVVFPFGLPGDIAVPNDYDGGGKTDAAVFRPSDGNWYFWFTETQQFGAVHFGATGDRAVPADYDGDGKTDVAIYRPSEGNWYILKSSDGNWSVTHWGIETDKPVPADYDGDGRADLAVFRSGTWYLLRSLNNAAYVIQWGAPTDVPLPIYRNALSADVVTYRASQNFWYNLTYIGPPTKVIQLGGNQDVPIYFGLPNN
jgi:hypothetical protein